MFSKKQAYNKSRIVFWLGYLLIASSFIFVANNIPFNKLITLPSFYTDILFALVVTFMVGFYVQYLNNYLDKKLSWFDNLKKRLLRQLLLGVLAPLSISILFEAIYLRLINIPFLDSTILNVDLPLAFLFLLLVNLFYMVSYLYLNKKTEIIVEKIQEKSAFPPKVIEYLTVQVGFVEKRLDISNCALLMSTNKIVWVHTFSGDKYRLNGTLEEWEEKLKGESFYRINRQCIACKYAIQSVEQTLTRKLKVNFVIPTDDIYISKLNIASFRKWWKP